MARVGDADGSRLRIDRPHHDGDHAVLHQDVEEAIQRGEHFGRALAGYRIGAYGATDLSHQCGRGGTFAHDVTHAEHDVVVVELEDVVPVAADVGPGSTGAVLGVEVQTADGGKEIGEHGALEDLGDDVLALEPGRVRQRHAGAAGDLGGQGDIVGLERATGTVEERHHPDDLPVGGERHGQRRGFAPPGVIGHRGRREMDTAGPVGDGGRRVGVERNVVHADEARFGWRLEDLCRTHIESLQPTVAGDLHHAGIGEPAHHEVHRPLDHRRRIEAGAQQTRDVGEQGQAFPGRLRVAQGLAFLLEELGPLERLCRQSGQGREKP